MLGEGETKKIDGNQFSQSKREKSERERASNEKILSLDTQKNAERERDRKPNHGSKKSWFNAPLYKEKERERRERIKKGFHSKRCLGRCCVRSVFR